MIGAKLKKRHRFEILKRDGFRCVYCGATSKDARLHVDHVIPRAKGGSNRDANLATACEDCNLGKAAVELERIHAEAIEDVPETVVLRCDDCGTNIACGFKDRIKTSHGGWLAWFSDQSGTVTRFVVRCASCHRSVAHAESVSSEMMHDIPLEWASGARALPRLYRMITDRPWAFEQREHLFDVMFAVQFLPTWMHMTPSNAGMP